MIRNLSVAAVALAISMPATAQTPAQKYGFCYGAAGNPRLENITRIFATSASSRQDSMIAEFVNGMSQKYGGFYTQENDCPMRATQTEAETYRRQLIDDLKKNAPSWPTVRIDWLPKGATALSGPVEKATAPAPKPQTSASAPAASTAVQLDMWGKPIPTTAYWTCVSHMTPIVYATKPFFAATNQRADNELYDAFNNYLIKIYHQAGTTSCNKFTTQAEAQKSLAQQEAAAPSTGYKWVGIDWTYSSSAASPPAAAPAPAPVPAPKPVAPAPAAPAAATPPLPAPAKPSPAAVSKPAAYVFCRSEFNTSMKRFYNPPVDGRGATYSEWQPSYKTYLEKNYGPQTNLSCGKYPTKEAAQKDYDEAVANARAQPTINGLQSPIVISNWVY